MYDKLPIGQSAHPARDYYTKATGLPEIPAYDTAHNRLVRHPENV